VDVSSPTGPTEVGSFDTADDAWGVTVSEGYAYVAAEAAGLYVLDVSDPANPYEVGQLDTPGSALNARVRDGYAYVADYSGGLRIVDISDPEDPNTVSSVSAQDEVWDVDLAGTSAYVADYGLRVIDVSDPADPTETGSFEASDDTWDVSVSGSYAYLAADGAGVRTIDVADPANPDEVGYFDTPDPAFGVTNAGAHTYVAAEEGGVYIIRNQVDEDVTPPAVPTGLSAEAGDREVTLTWNPNTESDLAEYRLYRFVLPQRETEYVDDISAGTETFTDTDLTNGREHSYWVTAVDDAGNESDFSEEVQVTPEGNASPTAFVWPVDAPRVSQDYATFNSGAANRYHLGIDLISATGSDNIYAADYGEVVFSGTGNPAYGTYVVINHGDGVYALYAHLASKENVTSVDPGDRIGEMGQTGDTQGTHLHFDVITRSSPPSSVDAFDNGYHTDHPATIGHPDPKSYLPHERVRVTTPTLNVRIGPGTNFSPVEGNPTVSEDQEFVAVGPAVNGWRLVYLPYDVIPSTDLGYFDYARYGWVSERFLSNSTTAQRQIRIDGEALVSDGGIYLNVRSAPDASSTALTKVWGGQRFITFGIPQNGTGSSEPWYKIHLPSNAGASAGWVAGDYISLPGDATEDRPAAPTGLTASAGESQVTLSWEEHPEDDVVGYNLYRSTSSFSAPSEATRLNESTLISNLTYPDTEFSNNTTYHYRLTAVNEAGSESSLSPEVTATPGDEDEGKNPSPEVISDYANQLSTEYKIPAVILKAVIEQESIAWKQYCDEDIMYIDRCQGKEVGDPIIRSESRGRVGIGLMQITVDPDDPRKGLGYTEPGSQGQNQFITTVDSIDVSVDRLKTDWRRNLEVGARILLAKKVASGGEEDDAKILENWYYPLVYYNGTGDRDKDGIRDNDPKKNNFSRSETGGWTDKSNFPYQEGIFNIVAQFDDIIPPERRQFFGPPIKVTLPGPAGVKEGAGRYEFVDRRFCFFDFASFLPDGRVRMGAWGENDNGCIPRSERWIAENIAFHRVEFEDPTRLQGEASVVSGQRGNVVLGGSGAEISLVEVGDPDGGQLQFARYDETPPDNDFDGSAETPDGSTVTPDAVADRYWDLSAVDLNDLTFEVQLDAAGIDGGRDEDRLLVLKRETSTSAWTPLNTRRKGNTLVSEALTSFSEFTVGWSVRPSTIDVSVNQPFGDPSDESNYRLVALPGDGSVPVSSTLDGEAGDAWRVFWDNGQSGSKDNYLVEHDGSDRFQFAPGRGFWMLGENAWQSSGEVETVSLDEDGTYPIDLHDGWNIVSNPFGTDVDWSTVQDANGVTQTLWHWNGSYQEASSFASARTGRAYYFFNERGLDELTLPYPTGADTDASATEAVQAQGQGAKAPPSLALRATAEGDSLASGVTVGRAENAEDGIDARDQYAPPGAFADTRLHLAAPFEAESGHDRLAAEYRPAGSEGQRFEVVLQTDETASPVTLRAEGAKDAFDGQAVALVNRRTAQRYDLRERSSVRVQPETDTTRFSLLVGPPSFVEREARRIAPQEAKLLGSYPNPFRTRATIAYAVPEPSRVRLLVYDLLGRRVRTLVDDRQQPGRKQARLEGRGLSSGVYVYRLEIGDYRATGKVVLVR
jgi:murein DD-endopeptidase MepM/ murein hydrolase activator NlpD